MTAGRFDGAFTAPPLRCNQIGERAFCDRVGTRILPETLLTEGLGGGAAMSGSILEAAPSLLPRCRVGLRERTRRCFLSSAGARGLRCNEWAQRRTQCRPRTKPGAAPLRPSP